MNTLELFFFSPTQIIIRLLFWNSFGILWLDFEEGLRHEVENRYLQQRSHSFPKKHFYHIYSWKCCFLFGRAAEPSNTWLQSGAVGCIMSFLSLGILQDRLYWTDVEDEAIYSANRLTGHDVAKVAEHLNNPLDLVVFHEQRQPKGESCSSCLPWSSTRPFLSISAVSLTGRYNLLYLSQYL